LWFFKFLPNSNTRSTLQSQRVFLIEDHAEAARLAALFGCRQVLVDHFDKLRPHGIQESVFAAFVESLQGPQKIIAGLQPGVVPRVAAVNRVKLTSLAPDIVAAILDDDLPSGITLFDFSEDVPLLWEEQRGALRRQKLAGLCKPLRAPRTSAKQSIAVIGALAVAISVASPSSLV
jgi:hypothetical protein